MRVERRITIIITITRKNEICQVFCITFILPSSWNTFETDSLAATLLMITEVVESKINWWKLQLSLILIPSLTTSIFSIKISPIPIYCVWHFVETSVTPKILVQQVQQHVIFVMIMDAIPSKYFTLTTREWPVFYGTKFTIIQ